ncbi:transposon Tf2-11 polyprotein [Nephila pilipes]|uniref:RNA-directed DNA polymerase n=1 Tax=Nephila pilipes TaxID=299642 RepID=A0A8X6NVL0_NEPPI|nr:transposon Tf2-11 polyprotein [Nephila pilipes]
MRLNCNRVLNFEGFNLKIGHNELLEIIKETVDKFTLKELIKICDVLSVTGEEMKSEIAKNIITSLCDFEIFKNSLTTDDRSEEETNELRKCDKSVQYENKNCEDYAFKIDSSVNSVNTKYEQEIVESFNRVPTANIEVGKQSQIHCYNCHQLSHMAPEYEISNGIVSPDNNNIEIIKNLKPPTNVKSLQRFLGSINVYHRFIDKYAIIRHPLNQLLKKEITWKWANECQEAFELLKQALICKPILKLFKPKSECQLFVDDCRGGGEKAVLKQSDSSGDFHPVAIHSWSLKDHEKNYGITEMECLAIVDSLNIFHHYLLGQKFTIHTNHAALIRLKIAKNLKGRLFRWSLQLSMFEYNIKYTKDSTNFEADMLPRDITEKNTKSEGGVTKVDNHVSHLLQLEEIKEA